MPAALALALAAAVSVLAGCAPGEPPAGAPPVIEHVHGIAEAPGSDDLLLATHDGVFTVAPDGALAGPVGGHAFDAMGFTVDGATLFASGHPGPTTRPVPWCAGVTWDRGGDGISEPGGWLHASEPVRLSGTLWAQLWSTGSGPARWAVNVGSHGSIIEDAEHAESVALMLEDAARRLRDCEWLRLRQ